MIGRNSGSPAPAFQQRAPSAHFEPAHTCGSVAGETTLRENRADAHLEELAPARRRIGGAHRRGANPKNWHYQQPACLNCSTCPPEHASSEPEIVFSIYCATGAMANGGNQKIAPLM